MAKFIIEVDDDFIRENAAKMDVNTDGTKRDFMKALFDTIAYLSIARRIDKGETEFHVSRDMMADDYRREYLERNVTDVLMLASLTDGDGKKGEE